MPSLWKAQIGPLLALSLLSSGCSSSTLLLGAMGDLKHPTGKILRETTRTAEPSQSEVRASNPSASVQGLAVNLETRPLCIAQTTTHEWHERSSIGDVGYSWALIGTEALLAAGLWYWGTRAGWESADSTMYDDLGMSASTWAQIWGGMTVFNIGVGVAYSATNWVPRKRVADRLSPCGEWSVPTTASSLAVDFTPADGSESQRVDMDYRFEATSQAAGVSQGTAVLQGAALSPYVLRTSAQVPSLSAQFTIDRVNDLPALQEQIFTGESGLPPAYLEIPFSFEFDVPEDWLLTHREHWSCAALNASPAGSATTDPALDPIHILNQRSPAHVDEILQDLSATCSEALRPSREALCLRSLQDAEQPRPATDARQLLDSNRNTPLSLQDIKAYLDRCNTP